jgi:hypothetical protein
MAGTPLDSWVFAKEEKPLSLFVKRLHGGPVSHQLSGLITDGPLMFHEDVLLTCLPLLFDPIREPARFCCVDRKEQMVRGLAILIKWTLSLL